jgi:hypothetical protein
LKSIHDELLESKNANLPARGLPIYIDPLGLSDAERTMQSPVQIELEGVPLKSGLRLLLKQLGLNYVVKDGMIVIDTPERFAAEFAEGQPIEGDPPVPGYGAMPRSGFPKAPDQSQGAMGGMMGGGFR